MTGLDPLLYKETGMTLSLQNFYSWGTFNTRRHSFVSKYSLGYSREFVIPRKHKKTEWERKTELHRLKKTSAERD